MSYLGKSWDLDDPRRAKLIARNKSPEGRRISSMTHKGKQYSSEVRMKISCSKQGWKPSDELRARWSKTRKGHSVSEETRRKQSETNIKTWSSLELREKARQTSKKLMAEGKLPNPGAYKNTSIERKLAWLLREAGICFIQNKNFGRFKVDFYLPEYHLALEADGTYWHQKTEKSRPGYYGNRDSELMEKFQLPVSRILDTEMVGWKVA